MCLRRLRNHPIGFLHVSRPPTLLLNAAVAGTCATRFGHLGASPGEVIFCVARQQLMTHDPSRKYMFPFLQLTPKVLSITSHF